MRVAFELNGQPQVVDAPPLMPLAELLRETLLLTGTKAACGEGFCGACTVHLDGVPVLACLTPISLLGGRAVRTVEGLASSTRLSTLQTAMVERDAVQCGMCFPGMLMTLTAFLQAESEAGRQVTETSLRKALTGNLCRCTGYQGIVEATLAAAGTPPEQCS